MATTYYMSAISLIVQYLTNVGVIAAGGKVYTYEAGTSTPQTTYTDSTGVVANANPLTLSSSGRPQDPSAAPVAFWAAAGTSLKVLVTDSAGNQLVSLDNVPGINDPSGPNSLQTLLAAPGAGDGADLVANAVRSYDIVVDVQSSPVPSLASGQTLCIVVQGGAAVGDGKGGIFYWSATSTATDDAGLTTIKPTAAGTTGRYLRLFASEIGSFAATLEDNTNSGQVTLKYERTGNIVHLWADAGLTIASADGSLKITGLPASITPSSARFCHCGGIVDDATGEWAGEAQVQSTGTINLQLLITGTVGALTVVGVINGNGFSTAGAKGIQAGWSITYGM